MTVKFVPNDRGNPPGKLADAELHFDAPDSQIMSRLLEGLRDRGIEGADFVSGMFNDVSQLAGLKLIGFAVWERRTGNGRNVTFPARQYSVNGERRSFALLRPIGDVAAQDRVRDLILDAFAEYEREQGHP